MGNVRDWAAQALGDILDLHYSTDDEGDLLTCPAKPEGGTAIRCNGNTTAGLVTGGF